MTGPTPAIGARPERQKGVLRRARSQRESPRTRAQVYPVSLASQCLSAASATYVLRPGLCCVVDAIDAVSAKLDPIARATAQGIPIISSMGAGNKLDPTPIEVADISRTAICPLSRVPRRSAPGSVSFVTPVFGFVAASVVARDIIGESPGASCLAPQGRLA